MMDAANEKKMLDHMHRIDAERKAIAIDRRAQSRLRDLTPGTATPASVRARLFEDRL